ncbi:MAG: hypothetical protein ABDK92_01165 [Atribacterota bacterium]
MTRMVSGFLEPIFTEKGLYGIFHTIEGFKVGFVSERALWWESVIFLESPEV